MKNVNTLRALAIDTVQGANSGHPGICMGAAPMAYTLFREFMNVNVEDTNWINRDRFVLSAGHGSALLYSLMHLVGYGDVKMEDLKKFRTLNSKTPGHPENFETKGIDATTGPLGQGIATAVGMAMAQRYTASLVGEDIIDHHTFVLCGDGDLQEGISYEACSYAGHNKLNKLVIMYDSNDITLDGKLSDNFSENIEGRFTAQGWNYIRVNDGEDLVAIKDAITNAKNSDKPTLIEVKTIIGHGSPNKQGTSSSHGAPLGEEEILLVKENYNLPMDKFNVDSDVYADFANIQERGLKAYEAWNEKVAKLDADKLAILKRLQNKEKVVLDMAENKETIATRIGSQFAINQIASQDNLFIGGSADLSCSNNTIIKTDGKFLIDNDSERNIFFGIREFAMGAMVNGMTLHSGLTIFGSTFMVFSDYLKPAIRLAALMELPVIYPFTHDSIAVGEDGPTHQPIEQLSMFRSMPNTNVFRPCDANETQAAWQVAYESTKTPSILSLTRQNLENVTADSYADVLANFKKGAYVILDCDNVERILIASGSEVKLAIDVAKKLGNTRVVSMPCQELYDMQSAEYKEEILPRNIDKTYIELGATNGNYKYANNVIGMDTFGRSGEASTVLSYFDFTVDKIAERIECQK